MKRQFFVYSVISLILTLVLIAEEQTVETYLYPLDQSSLFTVFDVSIEDKEGKEFLVGEELNSVSFIESNTVCVFEEACLDCANEETCCQEESVCSSEGVCCCCPFEGGEELLGALPVGGFGSGGSSRSTTGAGLFGRSFVGIGTSTSNGNSNQAETLNNGSVNPKRAPLGDEKSVSVSIPEPSTWLILGSLLALLAIMHQINRVKTKS